MDVLWQDTSIQGEQPMHRQLILQQLHLHLQSVVLPCQDLDPSLHLLRPRLGLLHALPHHNMCVSLLFIGMFSIRLLLLLHAGHGVVLLLEVVHVLGQLSVDVLGQDADVGEERPQHRQLLLQQLHLLLQPLVLPRQDLDPLLRLPRPCLGLLSALPHGHVVPLPAAPVLVRVPVHLLLAHRSPVVTPWLQVFRRRGEALEGGQGGRGDVAPRGGGSPIRCDGHPRRRAAHRAVRVGRGVVVGGVVKAAAAVALVVVGLRRWGRRRRLEDVVSGVITAAAGGSPTPAAVHGLLFDLDSGRRS